MEILTKDVPRQCKALRSSFLLPLFLGIFFLAAAFPADAITVVDSSTVTVTATVNSGETTSSSSSSTGGGSSSSSSSSGGGGGGIPASVTFSGRAYPLSRVILLKDGQEAINTVSGPDARFTISISNLNSGTFTFSILGEDYQGRRSTLFTIPISVTYGVSSTISGIFLSPTIDINKQTVKRGESVTIFGQTAPDSEVTIAVHSSEPVFKKTQADANGVYLYSLDTAPLEYGSHNAQSKAELAATNEATSYGKVISFTVGDTTKEKSTGCDALRGDLNHDCRVSLIDFSILAYWYKKSSFPPADDLNSDGKISLIDFSIMAYYWTG